MFVGIDSRAECRLFGKSPPSEGAPQAVLGRGLERREVRLRGARESEESEGIILPDYRSTTSGACSLSATGLPKVSLPKVRVSEGT